jgi:hypothetical protein
MARLQEEVEAAVLEKGQRLTRKEKRALVQGTLAVHQMALF